MALDSHIIGAIVLAIILIVIVFPTAIVIFKKSSSNSKIISWLNKEINSSSNKLSSKIFPSTRTGLFLMMTSIIIGVAILVLIILGTNNMKENNLLDSIDRNETTIETFKESFANEGSGNTVTYKPIGFGPVIDKQKIIRWLNGNSGIQGTNPRQGETTWLDGNGEPINIRTDYFRSLYGFIPPSFSYYPKGQTRNDYNYKNYKEGRENCMKACSLTDCTAVQTEVPENCSQMASTNGINSCGDNSEFSCTLFYENIKKADDAYWTLSKYNDPKLTNSKSCFTETGTSCLGKKYYEDNQVSTTLPVDNVKPSQSIIKFCESSNTDPNAICVQRPLLTTEYTMNHHPYYNVPINLSKIYSGISTAQDSVTSTNSYINGTPYPCGIVNGKLKSCKSTKACDDGESDDSDSNCWVVDESKCSGSAFGRDSGKESLDTYLANYNQATTSDGKIHPGANYEDLYGSCYYRQLLTATTPIQFGCNPDSVERGCYGSPPILYTDSLSGPNNFAACSDTSVIPTSQRCVKGSNIAACEGFPYACDSTNGTNTLWVKK